VTGRKEFVDISDVYARACGAQSLLLLKRGCLGHRFDKYIIDGHLSRGDKFRNLFNYEWHVLKDSSDAAVVLLNNDSHNSRLAINEIRRRKWFSLSSADSDSLHIGSYFYGVYGNDDSTLSVKFLAKYFSFLIKENSELSAAHFVTSTTKLSEKEAHNPIYDEAVLKNIAREEFRLKILENVARS